MAKIVDYQSAVGDFFKRSLGAASNATVGNAYLKSTGYYTKFSDNLIKDTTKAQKRIAANTVESMDDFFSDMETKTKKSNKKQIDSLTERLEEETKTRADYRKKELKEEQAAERDRDRYNKEQKAKRKKIEEEEFRYSVENMKDFTRTAKQELERQTIQRLKLAHEAEKAELESDKRIADFTAKMKKKAGIKDPKMASGEKGIVSHVGGVAMDVGKDTLSELASFAKSAAPSIALFGSVSALIVGIVEKIFGLSAATQDLLIVAGGAREDLADFNKQLPVLRLQTGLSQDAFIELGKSFQAAGLPMTNLTANTAAYLVEAGKTVKMFGISDELAASYTKTLKQAGMSAGEVATSFNDLYSELHDTSGALSDIKESMEEGRGIWTEYGGIANAGFDTIVKGVQKTKDFFRSLNVEVKKSGDVLGSTFGDTKTQMRQAALIASQLGGSGYARFNEMSADPSLGAKNQMQANVMMMVKNLGNRTDTLTMTPQQIAAKYGEAGAAGINVGQRNFADTLGGRGMDKGALSQGYADYVGWVKKNGASAGPVGSQASTSAWMASRQAELARKGGANVAEGLKSVQKNPAEAMAELGERIGDVITSFATPLMKETVPQLMASLNDLTAHISGIAPLIQDAVDFMSGKSAHKVAAKTKAAFKDGSLGRAVAKNAPKGAGGIFGPGIDNLVNGFSWLPKPGTPGLTPNTSTTGGGPGGSFAPSTGSGMGSGGPSIPIPISTPNLKSGSYKGFPTWAIAAAREAEARTGVPASITLAQFQQESSMGRAMPKGSNNPFGIKASKSQDGVMANTWEQRKDGTKYRTMAKFRKFDSMGDAFAQHANLLANGQYFKKYKDKMGDTDSYIDAFAHTYATDHNYGPALHSIINSKNLKQFDVGTAKNGTVGNADVIAQLLQQNNELMKQLVDHAAENKDINKQAQKDNKRAVARSNPDQIASAKALSRGTGA